MAEADEVHFEPLATPEDEEKQRQVTAFAAPMVARAFGVKLPDMSKDQNLQTFGFSSTAPKWRIVYKGLNFESICKNTSCEAHNQWVWSSWGFRNNGLFDYFAHEDQVKCPVCQNWARPLNFGYYGTYFKVTGCKRNNENAPLQSVNTEWQWAPDNGITKYKYSEETMALWGRLEIRVSQTRPAS